MVTPRHADGSLFERIDAFDMIEGHDAANTTTLAALHRIPIGAAIDEEGEPSSFIQLCVIFDAGKPIVVMDYWFGTAAGAGGAARWIHGLVHQLLSANPALEVAVWGDDPAAAMLFGADHVVNLQQDQTYIQLMHRDLGIPPSQEPLGLKRAYSWYLFRVGEKSPVPC